MLQTGESGYYELEIEGIKFDFTNLVSEIRITEHITYIVPTCTLMLVDLSSFLNNEMAIRDGTKIRVKMGLTKDRAKIYDFRVFNIKYGVDSGSTVFEINCILDIPTYTHQVANLGFDGTSDSAIKEIANNCKIGYSGTSTDDQQIWLNFGSTTSSFVQFTADHGFIDSKSCMVVACTAQKVLKYKNLHDVFHSTNNASVFYVNKPNPDGDLYVNQAVFYTNSGFRNMWTGLTHKRLLDSICGSSSKKTVDIDIFKYLSVNKDIKDAIQYSRMDYSDFNTGNVHKNFYIAEYQNLRLKGFYSVYADIMFLMDNSGVELLDPVLIDTDNIKFPSKVPEENGKWIVMSITRVLRGGMTYGERLTLMRPDIHNSGTTKLVSK